MDCYHPSGKESMEVETREGKDISSIECVRGSKYTHGQHCEEDPLQIQCQVRPCSSDASRIFGGWIDGWIDTRRLTQSIP
jgi:hypothetical protein